MAYDIEVIRSIPGYEDVGLARECLDRIKVVYGLKDAPRAWRFTLHLVVVSFGLKPTLADPQIYVKFDDHNNLFVLLAEL